MFGRKEHQSLVFTGVLIEVRKNSSTAQWNLANLLAAAFREERIAVIGPEAERLGYSTVSSDLPEKAPIHVVVRPKPDISKYADGFAVGHAAIKKRTPTAQAGIVERSAAEPN